MLWKRVFTCYAKRALHLESYQRFSPLDCDEKEFKTFPLLNPFRNKKGDEKLQEMYSSLYEERKQTLEQLKNNFEGNKLPSVSNVLSKTMSKESLEALGRWERKMIAELGLDGFNNMKKEIFSRGSKLHKCVFSSLKCKEKEIDIPENVEELWKSIKHILPTVGEVSFLETKVLHPYLCYQGIVDCVAHYENKLALIEWKTSSRTKPTLSALYDAPIQAVAYAGAVNFDNNFKLQIDNVVIVIAYIDGTRAHAHRLSNDLCAAYWNAWLSRVKTYWENARNKG